MRNITKKIASIGIPVATTLATRTLTDDWTTAIKAGVATCFAHHAIDWVTNTVKDHSYYRRVREIGAEKLWNLPPEIFQRIEKRDRKVLGMTAAVGLLLTIAASSRENIQPSQPETPHQYIDHTLENLF